jgi:uncharacterized repeat protein (TIGR03803 family)
MLVSEMRLTSTVSRLLVTASLSGAMLAACEASKLSPPAASGAAVPTTLRTGRILTQSPKETVLWNFDGGSDGGDPLGGIIADGAGNFYGTASAGAAHDVGTVFKLTQSGSAFKETTLMTFRGLNGAFPSGPLIMDSSGTLYGTAVEAGRHGGGTVFRIRTRGRVRSNVIWNFGSSPKDGVFPFGGLTFGARGVLYGAATESGLFGGGVVFKLTPSGVGYTETILHEFGGDHDGKYPSKTLTLGPGGVIYGTTNGGGNGCARGCGTIFKLTPTGSSYAYAILYAFRGGADGDLPSSELTVDSSGAMYGVTNYGGGGSTCDSGGYGCGTLYELTPSGSGFSERVLWSFGYGTDGYYPLSNVVIGENGTLYGTTWQGGPTFGGTFYELTPGHGSYTEKILLNFSSDSPGGYDPEGNLVTDRRHLIFGTAYVGGSSEFPDGTVFRIRP